MDDAGYMGLALELARAAARDGEVPVGAVAVRDGAVIGGGRNRREQDKDPFAHAELFALREAAAAVGAWRLTGVSLYVTLEPCVMCAGALWQARIDRLIFGAMDPKGGAAGSLYDVPGDARLNHRVQVTRGVRESECALVLKEFFEGLRADKRGEKK